MTLFPYTTLFRSHPKRLYMHKHQASETTIQLVKLQSIQTTTFISTKHPMYKLPIPIAIAKFHCWSYCSNKTFGTSGRHSKVPKISQFPFTKHEIPHHYLYHGIKPPTLDLNHLEISSVRCFNQRDSNRKILPIIIILDTKLQEVIDQLIT